jgi:hypothetical protein
MPAFIVGAGFYKTRKYLVGSGVGVDRPIVFRKMVLEVAAIVKNSSHLDHAIIAAAVQEKMARCFHSWPAHSVPAKFQGICSRAADYDLEPLIFFR